MLCNFFSPGRGEPTWLATARHTWMARRSARARWPCTTMLKPGHEEPVRCVSALQVLGGGGALLDVCQTVPVVQKSRRDTAERVSKQLEY